MLEDDKSVNWNLAFKEVEDGERAKQEKAVNDREKKLKLEKKKVEKEIEAQKAAFRVKMEEEERKKKDEILELQKKQHEIE